MSRAALKAMPSLVTFNGYLQPPPIPLSELHARALTRHRRLDRNNMGGTIPYLGFKAGTILQLVRANLEPPPPTSTLLFASLWTDGVLSSPYWPFLKEMTQNDNNFVALEDDFSEWSSLSRLALSSNRIRGTLPMLGGSAETIRLSRNEFYGTLPSAWGALRRLETVYERSR
jgi:hypothetical protein